MVTGTGSLTVQPTELQAAEAALWERYGSSPGAGYSYHRRMLPILPGRGSEPITIGRVRWELYADGEMKVTIRSRACTPTLDERSDTP
jgi:hypothetical protein